MTWLLWVGLALCMLAVAAVGFSAYGAKRWAGSTLMLTRALDAARVDARVDPPRPTRYDSRELEGLPAPVQRYFRAVLKDGQPIITAVTIDMAGTFNMSAAAEQWKPFTSRQRVVTRRPGFLWDAKIAMLPGLPVRVVDSYIAGNGLLRAANSCATSLKRSGTRPRYCPARVCAGMRSTTVRRMRPSWMARSR